MTYEEIVKAVRDVYENADAREIYEHIAVEVDIRGEGEGAFYIEVANRQVCVEPYEYYDRDAKIITNAETLLAISEGTVSVMDVYQNGDLKVEGNLGKVALFAQIKLPEKKVVEKKTVAKKTTEKKPAEKKVTEKKSTTKKSVAKKTEDK